MVQPAHQLTQRAYSLAEYFSLEAMSDIKHEYYAGSIYAMAGAPSPHNRIAGNIFAALHGALRGSPCEPFGSDMRVNTPSGLYTYPDVSVLCGPFDAGDDNDETTTMSNPTVLVEVLSDATRQYDRDQKFELYRAIPTLRDYILVEQTAGQVEHRSRIEEGQEGEWSSSILASPDDVLELPWLPFRMTLRDIYERVEFAAGTPV